MAASHPTNDAVRADPPVRGACERRDWCLKRNCSVSPRQLLGFYLSLAAVSLGIALAFWWHGATLVLPFAWLELAALGACLWIYARHATDRELVHLRGGVLEVVWVNGRRELRQVFNPQWVQVQHEGFGLVRLSGQGTQALLGRYVRPERRAALAGELRSALARR
jgi:uncharacterized membrane protein